MVEGAPTPRNQDRPAMRIRTESAAALYTSFSRPSHAGSAHDGGGSASEAEHARKVSVTLSCMGRAGEGATVVLGQRYCRRLAIKQNSSNRLRTAPHLARRQIASPHESDLMCSARIQLAFQCGNERDMALTSKKSAYSCLGDSLLGHNHRRWVGLGRRKGLRSSSAHQQRGRSRNDRRSWGKRVPLKPLFMAPHCFYLTPPRKQGQEPLKGGPATERLRARGGNNVEVQLRRTLLLAWTGPSRRSGP